MGDVGKKRKRVIDGTPSPNKRIAITHSKGKGLHPVVITSTGIKAPTITFDAYSKAESTPKPTDALILQSSKHPRLDYTASPIGTEDNLAHYIAVYDPMTDTLKVTPAHHAQLQCVLRTEAVEDTPRKTLASQRIALGQEFGTKKAKKAIASKTVNAITAGAKDDVQLAILEEVAEQTGKEQVVELSTQLQSKPIPQPNLNAATVEEVYPLATLIPIADMRLVQVSDWQEKARAEENLPQPHRFTAFRVAAISKGDDIDRLKALRYVGLLLQFNDALINAGRSGKKVPKKDVLTSKLKDFPDALVDSVRRRFAVSNELGKWQLENLHTHICALGLYIDHWRTDVSNIRDDLRLDNSTMQQFYTELGCKTSAMTEKERTAKKLTKGQAANVRMATLKLPLEFPTVKTGRRR